MDHFRDYGYICHLLQTTAYNFSFTVTIHKFVTVYINTGKHEYFTGI